MPCPSPFPGFSMPPAPCSHLPFGACSNPLLLCQPLYHPSAPQHLPPHDPCPAWCLPTDLTPLCIPCRVPPLVSSSSCSARNVPRPPATLPGWLLPVNTRPQPRGPPWHTTGTQGWARAHPVSARRLCASITAASGSPRTCRACGATSTAPAKPRSSHTPAPTARRLYKPIAPWSGHRSEPGTHPGGCRARVGQQASARPAPTATTTVLPACTREGREHELCPGHSNSFSWLPCPRCRQQSASH